MSYLIPVFLLPVDPAHLASLQVEGRVEDAIARAQTNPGVSGLRVATSANRWHCVLAVELCREWRIDGLGFLGDSLRILSPDEASASARAVAGLIQHLRTNPIPCLARDLGPELEALEGADRTAAADAAAPVHEVDEATGAVHSFFQFLATLEQAGHDAAGSGRHLLFYAPSGVERVPRVHPGSKGPEDKVECRQLLLSRRSARSTRGS